MSSSSFVPRTARDLLVPPTPAGSHDRPRGPLTLRLPPLSSFAVVSKPSPTKPARRKGSTASRKRKRDDFDDDLDLLGPGSTITYSAPKKPARRKPLNELLPGLISRIKKKDSYTFFLKPVDPALAPGYVDVVKTPMDFGTMSRKVERAKYKTMDDFKRDFDLVVDNARAYNPAGSIYHAEADRIAQFGHEIIDKALMQLDYSALGVEDNVSGSDTESISDASSPPAPPASQPSGPTASIPAGLQPLVGAQLNTGTSSSRRTKGDTDDPTALLQLAAGGATGQLRRLRVRAHALKDNVKTGEDGSLPGSAEGVGAFPRGHGAAQALLALRTRPRKVTKKERMRLEKEGPPRRADCSLDFMRVENPFQTLSPLLELGDQRPQIVPLPQAPLLSTDVRRLRTAPPPKFKFWMRGGKPMETRDNQAGEEREAGNHDWGVHALLNAIMDMQQGSLDDPGGPVAEVQGAASLQTSVPPASEPLGEAALLGRIRDDIAAAPARAVNERPGSSSSSTFLREEVPAQEIHLREFVYGSTDGLAYASSVARFVAGAERARVAWSEEETARGQAAQDRGDILIDIPSPTIEHVQLVEDAPVEDDQPEEVQPKQENEQPPPADHDTAALRRDRRKWRHGPLHAASLSEYVEREIIRPLTGDMHEIVSSAGRILTGSTPSSDTHVPLIQDALSTKGPLRKRQRDMFALVGDKIDLAPILRAPPELYTAETGWKAIVQSHATQQRKRADEERAAKRVKRETKDGDALSAMRAAAAQFAETASIRAEEDRIKQDTASIVHYALGLTATALEHMMATTTGIQQEREREIKPELDVKPVIPSEAEDEMQRALRLQLLALAKRAPIKLIQAVPPELVPPRVRAAFTAAAAAGHTVPSAVGSPASVKGEPSGS